MNNDTNNVIVERINKIRELMRTDNVTYYLVDTADPHLSEYISDYYKQREFLSGFTGSNGTLLIGLDTAFLWTDGRYFIQAENELAGTGITLMKMGDKGVQTLAEFIKNKFSSKDILAFNGFLLTARIGMEINKIAKISQFKILYDKDYCSQIWNDRPDDSAEKIYILNELITGNTATEKLNDIREKIKQASANCLFVSKLDDIMWLYNIRGNDIECNPVCYAYSLITSDKAYIYLKEKSITEEVKKYFDGLGIFIKNYQDINNVYELLSSENNLLIDKNTLNYSVYEGFSKRVNLIQGENPIELAKAIKNDVEIENSKKCYLDDSVALTKFLMTIKEKVKQEEISEYEAAMLLDNMRKEIPGFIELSFPTISAYGPNAAMMHYEATKDNTGYLKPEGLYLVDSGATYYNGTTDVTRTIALGKVTDEMKMHFTLALAGMLRLQNAVFMKGATGRNLDILARGPLWEKGIDYKCGTGHGVGYILNVHEGPQSIRTKRRKGEEETEFAKGMIVSDEPGVYKADSHGIRIENILLCDEYMSTGDGDFLHFIPLTLVPIDLDVVDTKYLNSTDIMYLNDYHKLVYEKLSPYFEGEELAKLKEMTRYGNFYEIK